MNRMQNGQIVNMRNFTAPYEFREYPKHVKLIDGSVITVNSAEEEAAAVGEEHDEAENDERSALMAQARALGLNPHHKLGADKLRELINASQSHS
jgi:hypothetical protein